MTAAINYVWQVLTQPKIVLLHLTWWFCWILLMWTIGADLW